jgi:hypothetical protein
VPSIDEMNADELMVVLSDTARQLEAGDITPKEANAVSRAVGRRLDSMGAALRAVARLRGLRDRQAELADELERHFDRPR